VVNAATLVGEKTLVRIEKVGRSAAQASLVNPPEGLAQTGSDGDAGSGEAPRPRRRGRRGGRGRRNRSETAPS
jgi:ribonuclease G